MFLSSQLRFFSALFVFLFLFSSEIFAQVTGEFHERYYTVSNPNGVYGFQEYASPTFQQDIVSQSDTETVIRVRTALRAPQQMNSTFPVTGLSDDFDQYLGSTRWIQSDDSRIAEIADQILADHPSDNLHDIVYQVMVWNARHLQYGDPSGIHDAIYALENRVVNCIGFAHLPAAILRHLGIPARVVRTFVSRYPGFSRHYLLEVYYPEEDVWLTLEPQTVSAPFDFNVFLYHDSDWNQQKHLESRAFSLDPQTTVRLGMLSDLPEVHEATQLDRPEPEWARSRRVMGTSATSHGNLMAGLSYGLNIRAGDYPGSTHGDNLKIQIWEQQNSGASLIQKLNPSEDIDESFTLNERYFTRRMPLRLASLVTSFGSQYGFTQAPLAMSDRFLVIRLNGYTYQVADPAAHNGIRFVNGPLVIYEKQQDGSWEYQSTFRYPDSWYIDGNAAKGAFTFSPDGSLFIAGASSLIQLRFSNNRWTPTIAAPRNPKAISQFEDRNSVSIALNEAGGRLVIGASGEFQEGRHDPWEPEDSGFIEVFKKSGNSWESAGIFRPEEGHYGDQFGFSVAISGNRIVAGAPFNNAQGAEAGAAYVFEEDIFSGNITERAVLRAQDTIAEDQFGGRVLIDGMQVFVSAHQKATALANRGGGAYLFELEPGGEWAGKKLFTPGREIKNSFSRGMNTHLINAGFMMGFWDGQLILGAPGNFTWPEYTANSYGSYYFFDLPENPGHPLMVNADQPVTTVIQNIAPNPMFSAANIHFEVSEQKNITLTVLNPNDSNSYTLYEGELSHGTYQIRLDTLTLPKTELRLTLGWVSKDGTKYSDQVSFLVLDPDEDEVF